jgi:UDP-glucose 4-epimerase
VHVTDLAQAHLLALARLETEPGVTWNLGCGTGHSVLKVIQSVERISGLRVPYQMAPRRPGDPAVLVAASDRARTAGWRPAYEALDEIVRTAFAWREAHPAGYGG